MVPIANRDDKRPGRKDDEEIKGESGFKYYKCRECRYTTPMHKRFCDGCDKETREFSIGTNISQAEAMKKT